MPPYVPILFIYRVQKLTNSLQIHDDYQILLFDCLPCLDCISLYSYVFACNPSRPPFLQFFSKQQLVAITSYHFNIYNYNMHVIEESNYGTLQIQSSIVKKHDNNHEQWLIAHEDLKANLIVLINSFCCLSPIFNSIWWGFVPRYNEYGWFYN